MFFCDIFKKLKSIFIVPAFIPFTDIPCDVYSTRAKAKMIREEDIVVIVVMVSTKD